MLKKIATLIVIASLGTGFTANAVNYGNWGGTYLELPDFFNMFIDKLEIKAPFSGLNSECLSKQKQNSSFLGDVDSTSGTLMGDKPNAQFWAWMDKCLGSGGILSAQYINALYSDALGSPPTDQSGVESPWNSLGNDQKKVLTVELIHRIVHRNILTEIGINIDNYAQDLIDAGDQLDGNISVEDMMRLYITHVMTSPYFQLVKDNVKGART